MQKVVFLVLMLCVLASAHSVYFSDSFCKEIDFWNTRKLMYGYFEIVPTWTRFYADMSQFGLVIRF